MFSKIAVVSVFLLATNTAAQGGAGMQNRNDVKLLIKSAAIKADKLSIVYEIANKGTRPVFVVDTYAEDDIPGKGEHFFIEYEDRAGLVKVSSYIAELPRDRLLYAPISHPVAKLSAGDIRTMALSLPLQEKRPYPEQPGALIKTDRVRQIELRLGVIPCESLPTHQRTGSKSTYITGTLRIDCDGKEDAITAFQFFVENRLTLRKER